MQRALHQHLHFTFASQLYGAHGGHLAGLDVDNLDSREVQFHGLSQVADNLFGTDKNGNDQLVLERLNRAAERNFVARPGNRSPHRGL